MRAIISAPGSRGDVNPMLAIGERLAARGHEVVISLAEPYVEAAESAGLKAESLISRERFTEILGDQHVWKPVRGAIRVFKHMVRDFMPLHEQVIQKHHLPGQTVLVSHTLDLVSRIYRDADPSTPLVDVHLQPVILRTFDSPPRLSPWWWEISRPTWALRSLYWLTDLLVIDTIVRGPVNRLRADKGLPPVSRIYDQWWLSPDRVIALYPDWFAPATKDFCPQLVHCGFPLADVDGSDFTPPDNRPIAFTSGSAHHHCRRFFERAVDACETLNRPGLLLSTFTENFPPDLPTSIQTMGYASFAKLFPHCSAVVHHGGIGTTSQALAAGVPQVIRPMAFDQFDNATRVERLGCGRWLKQEKQLAGALQGAIDQSSRSDSRLRETAQRLNGIDAPEAAAIEIEQVFEQHS